MEASASDGTSKKKSSGTPPRYPSPEEFYIQYPLYQKVDFMSMEHPAASKILFPQTTVNAPCSECPDGHSIFKLRSQMSGTINGVAEYRFFVDGKCTRNELHRLLFIVHVDGTVVQKIGQIPSVADLHIKDVRKYAKVLPDGLYAELTKAIGLASHGVGVGSFVYLRRIFERLVEDAHKEARTTPEWSEGEYEKARMNDKIQLLKGHLPEFLVEHRAMYGVLSKGLHELSEDECLAMFTVVKVGIELVLDAKLELIAKQKKAREASAAIQALVQSQKAPT